jgi:hypothetical protein
MIIARLLSSLTTAAARLEWALVAAASVPASVCAGPVRVLRESFRGVDAVKHRLREIGPGAECFYHPSIGTPQMDLSETVLRGRGEPC